jgi:serine/threonine-protein kinase PknG
MGLVEVPPVPTGDPSAAIMAVPEVPEDKRFCSSCGDAVGRARDGQPGRTSGYCPNCGTPYDFAPKLTAGEVVGGQYEVLGALAHGGLGWVYLARDRAVSDRWVVLKGLLDIASEDAAIAAVAERRFLAALDHPHIVEIYNFVTHEGAGYIVMEYVGGKSLKQVLQDRRDANGGRIDPLPVDQAIAYVLGMLPAMGYLHDQGLVYCDMKPDNIVLAGNALKIIDLGGVRPVDDADAAIYGTVGYQAPEVAEVGPTVASDLFTVGRTLAVLVLDFRGYQRKYATSLPLPGKQPLLAAHESLHRFLLKATAADPTDRFGSAEEMAEQLVGVLREEAAARGPVQPAVSAIFGPDPLAVGGAREGEVLADWRLLPAPKVDPSDPAAGVLMSFADPDPRAVANALAAGLADRSVPSSAEALLRLARAHLDAGFRDDATATLDRLGESRDWRLWWDRGLVALAEQRAQDALDWLDPVCTDLPGEIAPKLALALAAETAGDLERAELLYDRAARTDPSYLGAAFGLARVRLIRGDRAGAVEAYERVPVSSSVHHTAQVATVRALVGDRDMFPTVEELQRASAIVEALEVSPRHRAELTCDVLLAALASLEQRGTCDDVRVLGAPLRDDAVRQGLEQSYRELARHASSRAERVRLVDEANQIRPETLV